MVGSGRSYGPTGTELQAIVKGYELFGVLLHEKIPPKVKRIQMWKLLKCSHVNVDFQYEHFERNTLLHMAVARGYDDIVNLLIGEHRADVNIENTAGETPLHVAVEQEDIGLVRLLVMNRADMTIKNAAGETPFDIAKERNVHQIIEVFESGIDVIESPTEPEWNLDASHSEETETPCVENQENSSSDAFASLPRTHAASGAKNTLHGTVYQLKLLMLFLVRALHKGYPFQLGTEVDEAEQFDDLVFKYQIDNSLKSLYLQAKHKENARTGEITQNDLLSNDKKAPFSLLKYFKSYLKIKERIGEKVNEIDFVICTNTQFQFKEPWKLIGDESLFLFREVKTSYDEFFKEGKCLKLDLCDKTLSVLRDVFVDALAEERKQLEIWYLQNKTKTLEMKIESLDRILSSVKESESINLRFFLDKLIFAVGQPDEGKLDSLIKTEFGANNNIHLLDADLLTDSFHKRMFDWFKEKNLIKGQEGSFLSNEDAKGFVNSIFQKVNNLISTGISRAYPEKLKKFAAVFNDNALNELSNLISKHRLLHCVSPCETRATAIRVSQALDKSGMYKAHDSCIFLQLSTLLNTDILNRTMDAYKSNDNNNLLVIHCFAEYDAKLHNDPLLSMLGDKLLAITANNPQKKLILIAQENHPLAEIFKPLPSVQVDNRFKELTCESQKIFFEKRVIFQGQPLPLSLLLVESGTELLEDVSVDTFVSGQQLVIGRNLPISFDDSKAFYVERNLKYQSAIKDEIVKDTAENKFTDLLSESEVEFNRLCQQHPEQNIHLIKEHLGKKLWIRTRGSLVNLRGYIDGSYSESYSEEAFIDMASHQKVVIISDSAGMGKSTVLSHISEQVKRKCPATFVFRIDLNGHTDELQRRCPKKFDNTSAVDFLCNHLIMISTPLERTLFTRSNQVVLLFDGFDEVCPDYNETVIDLLKNLKEVINTQLWITTRPFMREELENKLQQISYTLEPFSKSNQCNFLLKFWKQTLLSYEYNPERVLVFAKSLIDRLAASISDKEREFTAVPLQLRLLAECYSDGVKDFLCCDLPEPVLEDNFNLVTLYDTFITRKFGIYHTDKASAVDSNLAMKSIQKLYRETYMKHHQFVAVSVLLSEEKVKLFVPDYENPVSEDDTVANLNRIGIVNVVSGKSYFLHRTFAEYLFAKFLLEMLKEKKHCKKVNTKCRAKCTIAAQICMGDNYQVVRTFLNGLLVSYQAELLSFKCIAQLTTNGNHYIRIFHQAAKDGNNQILVYLCKCLKLHLNVLEKHLLSHDDLGDTVLHVALRYNRISVMDAFLRWTEDDFSREDGQAMLKNLLLTTNETGFTVLQFAARGNRIELTELLLNWTLHNMNKEQGESIQKNLFLEPACVGGGSEERPVLFEAARCGYLEMMKMLLKWVKENMDQGQEIICYMLVAKTNRGQTALHMAMSCITERLDFIDNLLKSPLEYLGHKQGGLVLKQMLLTRYQGCSVLNDALLHNYAVCMETFFNYIRKNMCPYQGRAVLRKLLLDRTSRGDTILHRAIHNDELFEMVLRWTKDVTDRKTLQQHLSKRNTHGLSVRDFAVVCRCLEIVAKLDLCMMGNF